MPPVVKLLLYFILVGCAVGIVLFGLLHLLQDLFAIGPTGAGVVRSMGPLLIPVLIALGAGWVTASRVEDATGVFSVGLVLVGSMLAAAAAFGVAIAGCNLLSTPLTPDRLVLILSLASGALAAGATLNAWIEDH